MKYKLENLQINLKAQNENETKQIDTVRQRQTDRDRQRGRETKQTAKRKSAKQMATK